MIKKSNKLEYLANTLVPDVIKNNSPQYYELVKAFLVNLESVQTSINMNFLDCIDFEKINNNEIKQIYIDTYLGQLDLKDEDNIESLGDLILVSKDLSVKKGTAIVYNLLINMLYYILPDIDNTFNTLLTEFNDPNTSEQRKAELEIIINEIKATGNIAGNIEVIENTDNEGNTIPFSYQVKSEIKEEVFEKYIKRFAHPAGWELEFTQAIIEYIFDTYTAKESVVIFDAFEYPFIDGSGDFDGNNTSLIYPNNYYEDALLGLEADYNTIASKLLDSSKLYIQDGNVYYRFDNLNNPYTVQGSITEGSQAIIKTPTITGIKPTGGSYTTTEEISYGNGCITGGTWLLTYQILINN